jgi:hypothetical protein
MRRFRRDVEFAVDSTDGLHWTWKAWLPTAEGPLCGTIAGSQGVAVKACIAAIDAALGESLLHMLPPGQAVSHSGDWA